MDDAKSPATPEDPKSESLRKTLEQYWLHCRHIENERADFMKVYAAIAGAIITFTFGTKPMESWPIYFLMVFTIAGFLLTWRWQQAFQDYKRKAEENGDRLGVTVDLDVEAKGVWKILRTRLLFLYFYAIVFVLLMLMVVIINKS